MTDAAIHLYGRVMTDPVYLKCAKDAPDRECHECRSESFCYRATAKLLAQQSTFRKDDAGKDQWHLLPIEATRAAIKVLAHGAAKYGPDNYQKGTNWSRYYDAAMRHMTAWLCGENFDPESGFSHLSHAATCLLILSTLEIRHIGTDDRPVLT